MVILSLNQKNGHKNRNVAKVQIKAQDISGGNEMVKLKTNESIAEKKKKANPPLWLEMSDSSRHAGGRGALALDMQLEENELAAALQELV